MGSSRSIALAVAAALAGGCSQSATLKLRGGREVRGEIIGGDTTTVQVEQSGKACDVRRADISRVSHPGVAPMIVGSLISVAGGGVLAQARWTDEDPGSGSGKDANCSPCKTADVDMIVGGIGAVAVGIVAATYGAVVHLGSRQRYAEHAATGSSRRQRARMPGALPTTHSCYPGSSSVEASTSASGASVAFASPAKQ